MNRRIRKTLLGVGLGALGAATAACGSTAASTSSTTAAGQVSTAPVTLTLWQNYGTEVNATATKNLISAFEKLHPNITINDVAQPASNYFSLLQAAAISHTGPDLAVMWTGLFTLQYKSYLENLKSWVPSSSIANMGGMQWTAPGFNQSNGTYVIPLEDQFYIGFYNKALFRKAGVTSVPRTWSELNSDCQKFKAAGITCLYYGSGSQSLGSEFYPFYDLSYMMIGNYSLAQWEGLYNGSIPWTSPSIVSQLTNWQNLYKNGYTNSNVVTAINSLTAFGKGQAAMMIKGNWDLATLEQELGSNLGVFVPPYSSAPQKGVVQFPGDGFAMTSYSTHKAAAAEFLNFLTTSQAGQIVAKAGLIPDVKGVSTSDPLSQTMLAFSQSQGLVQYPMLDNIVQPNIVTAASTVLPALLAGQMTPTQAAQKLQQAWQSLPSTQRGSTFGSYLS
ncbi:MAG: carbohydrate ABC transporter substrate-binding protein [Acidimicrobiaceae bacterium]|nr:carbohydrate ABC transporter substrate-binding protein [Acidimicrobiaceae bacterium]